MTYYWLKRKNTEKHDLTYVGLCLATYVCLQRNDSKHIHQNLNLGCHLLCVKSGVLFTFSFALSCVVLIFLETMFTFITRINTEANFTLKKHVSVSVIYFHYKAV